MGRPLALTSFLLQMPSWPTEPADFARANTLVHLLNSLLVIWLSYRLARYLPALPLRREWFALAVGATWASSPLLLSTSMMLIQRMTSLAALFGLGGLLAFVMGRELLAHRRRAGLLVMSAGLGLGTLAHCARKMACFCRCWPWRLKRCCSAPLIRLLVSPLPLPGGPWFSCSFPAHCFCCSS
ncbi:MAG: hypothetical protein IPJ33_03980 [Gammaproteobacteria bacterium]|nr:hypothetical protein [Gammaproteobacteria bacterium]